MTFNRSNLMRWLLQLKWTAALAIKWQEFYNNALRVVAYGRATYIQIMVVASPKLQDLEPVKCAGHIDSTEVTAACKTNEAIRQTISILTITILLTLKIVFAKIE
ncbi:unnamed protein product [Rotaria sp. Silwood1]|nr:unnamed protein product [Rotaria sp. Silwood1]CAF1495028.1 unnamed protein product [Rotaria sp. Silwood1]CAF1499764.1 unnamed protein product [Rotaria sp. Silwood1]CAF3645513.1 unnamed protein product [Rotaria sp. Silwood1]CAF3681529.1 unnamed protein product [Rotaria sp. Silwood1]